MKTKPYDGPDRRNYFRHNLIYSPKKRAKLKIENDEYEVLDLSQVGLRFIKESDTRLENLIRGILTFSNGEIKSIEGEIIWKKENLQSKYT